MFLIPIPPAVLQTQKIPPSESGQIAMGIALLLQLIVSVAILVGIIAVAIVELKKWYRKRKDRRME